MKLSTQRLTNSLLELCFQSISHWFLIDNIYPTPAATVLAIKHLNWSHILRNTRYQSPAFSFSPSEWQLKYSRTQIHLKARFASVLKTFQSLFLLTLVWYLLQENVAQLQKMSRPGKTHVWHVFMLSITEYRGQSPLFKGQFLVLQ